MQLVLVRNQLGTFMGCCNHIGPYVDHLMYPVMIQWLDMPIHGKVSGHNAPTILGINTQVIMVGWPSINLYFVGSSFCEGYSTFDSEFDKDNPFVKQYLQRVSEIWKIDLVIPTV